jgi:hypothetical protein
MRALILSAVIIAITASTADARRRHHRGYKHAPVMLVAPKAIEATRSERKRTDSVQLIPSGWQLAPPDPKWQGRRYLAPSGNGWIAFYALPAANDAQSRFKALAFGDDEQVTYLRGARDRLTVAGLKGDNVFFRKVTLACGGSIWRHVAMEYPAADKKTIEGFVEQLGRAFEQIADEGCGADVFSSPQPSNAPPKTGEKPAN